jgi:hypothetical protein
MAVIDADEVVTPATEEAQQGVDRFEIAAGREEHPTRKFLRAATWKQLSAHDDDYRPSGSRDIACCAHTLPCALVAFSIFAVLYLCFPVTTMSFVSTASAFIQSVL